MIKSYVFSYGRYNLRFTNIYCMQLDTLSMVIFVKKNIESFKLENKYEIYEKGEI